MTEDTSLREKALRDELAAHKAKSIARGKLLERFRCHLQEVVDHVSDEGDRAYFGSTNHFTYLKDIVNEMDMWNWDAIIRERPEVDPYAEMRTLRTASEAKDRRIEALEADNAKLESDNARLRGAISEAADCLDGEPEYHDQGMGCGLEDRGITDRYDAMAHGWEKAMERVYGENIAWAKDVLSSALSGKEGQS